MIIDAVNDIIDAAAAADDDDDDDGGGGGGGGGNDDDGSSIMIVEWQLYQTSAYSLIFDESHYTAAKPDIQMSSGNVAIHSARGLWFESLVR